MAKIEQDSLGFPISILQFLTVPSPEYGTVYLTLITKISMGMPAAFRPYAQPPGHPGWISGGDSREIVDDLGYIHYATIN